jgi:YebC/PmpR family DNA-binding regulatory protein
LGRDIVIAVKEGGPNPDTNPRLRAVIQNAKAANMPKANIERAIKKATDKDTANYKEVLYEGYAPHGVAVLVETATDNINRTVAEVRAAFSKGNGNMGNSGSVVFLFDHICNFKIAKKEELDLEELELELIDFEVEEVFPEDDHILIYAPFEQYGAIQKYLEENHFEIVSSGLDWIPTTQVEVETSEVEEVEKLLERLENVDDVQKVHHNMA